MRLRLWGRPRRSISIEELRPDVLLMDHSSGVRSTLYFLSELAFVSESTACVVDAECSGGGTGPGVSSGRQGVREKDVAIAGFIGGLAPREEWGNVSGGVGIANAAPVDDSAEGSAAYTGLPGYEKL